MRSQRGKDSPCSGNQPPRDSVRLSFLLLGSSQRCRRSYSDFNSGIVSPTLPSRLTGRSDNGTSYQHSRQNALVSFFRFRPNPSDGATIPQVVPPLEQVQRRACTQEQSRCVDVSVVAAQLSSRWDEPNGKRKIWERVQMCLKLRSSKGVVLHELHHALRGLRACHPTPLTLFCLGCLCISCFCSYSYSTNRECGYRFTQQEHGNKVNGVGCRPRSAVRIVARLYRAELKERSALESRATDTATSLA